MTSLDDDDDSFHRARRRVLRLALGGSAGAAALAALGPLAGCGGGVGEGGTGYASGPITGFGSVIVNDIVFDDSGASVEDGEGTARARSELRLGMVVEIDSGAIAGGNARASRVRFDSAVLGPVQSVEADGFIVLGQRVAVDATTVYDDALAAGLAALAVGQVVEVYGLFDAGIGRFRATRVERRSSPPLLYRLRGFVADLIGPGTLRIGTAFFSYAAGSAPAGLAAGSFVRLWVSTTPDLLGRWPVQRFGVAERVLPDIDGVSLKGYVTHFASPASFRVDGRQVDASAAVVSGGALALGARVEVGGSLRSGVLVASEVRVRSDQAESEREFDLRGPIERVAADRTSIDVRGVTIGLTRPGLVYIDGTPAQLTVGRSVEVRGVVSVGNGARLDATLVRFR
ncbi:MAG: hypothetical protein JNL85_06880 [Rubrivivax sp.]|nr:hypothetical protein [Rubrivivax sp.]